jgi:hypothetical protein
MPETPTFIMVEGLLHESGAFELRRVFEDTRAEPQTRFGGADGQVTVDLLDEGDGLLGRVRPAIRFPSGCGPDGIQVAQGLVRAALAYHPEARRLEVRVHERVVHSAPVSADRPGVKVSVRPVRKDVVPVRVTSRGSDVRVLAELEDGRRVWPSVRQLGGRHEVSLVSLEGLGRVRLVVEATRDCRTTRVVATEVDAPEATVSGVILEPEPGAQWSWGRRRNERITSHHIHADGRGPCPCDARVAARGAIVRRGCGRACRDA